MDCLPSGEYGVTTGKRVLELDPLGVLWRSVSRELRRALEMLRVIISKGYFLARRDIVRESISFCNVVSSAIRRLYLRVCEKIMFSLHLSERLEWKCRILAQSMGFLYRSAESGLLLYESLCLGRVSVGWSVQR